jgi:hypothetical protein
MIDRGCTMPRMSAIYLCLAALAASALAGCAQAPPYPEPTVYWGTFPQQPPDYSPDYASVPVVDRKGRTRYVLVPKACLTPDATEPPFLGPHLPPGCANAHNLQHMAERSAPLLRLRRRGRRKSTFTAPRAPWGVACRVRPAPCRRRPGLRAGPRRQPGRGECRHAGLLGSGRFTSILRCNVDAASPNT